MIAFASESRDDEEPSTPLLIVAPRIVMASPAGRAGFPEVTGSPEVTASDGDAIESRTARNRREFAMLRRALVRCGLAGRGHGEFEQ